MPNNQLLTDDYVAGLLAQDARDCSLKYSAMGMEAFRDRKKPSNMPKPNTRFLRHIIRDTHTHNKALVAKEAAESRARLEDFEYAEEVKRERTKPDAMNVRRRQMGDIQAILGGKTRRRENGGGSDRSTRRDRCESRDRYEKNSGTRRSGSVRLGDDKQPHRGPSLRDHADCDAESTRDDGGTYRRSKHHASSGEEDSRHRHGRSRRDGRSRSPRRHQSSCSPDSRKRSHRQRLHDGSRPRDSSHARRRKKPSPPPALDQDSDPLEDLIGPPPPPKFRGRGTIGGAAELDRRFSASYDPRLDVQIDEDEEDTWGDILESFRDRQKLKLHQDQRLKDAGFTEEEIQRAKGTATNKTGEQVVWSKAGEKREWDKGKDFGLDGAEDDRHPPTLFSEDY
ncbi:pre-mRNA-splicing factor 38B [Metarhizium album ARSEF 1941]|uniref:Pre-mRNA-splicing factor 38B n=1 Tax=Metarhizium album (strain ARSEF 1941) TaxID=1081103 RepID=A0A0B2WZJ0_METAS|nr:pre-mRNA-splicing factor 38B [Metarhizium album ARSEF 1941]KHN98837.1 pre-mRNA-splicing factor 38B [Metarhizium album ARSEF 1941]